MKHRKVKIVLTLALVIGGVGFIASQSVSEAEYYVHVDALHQRAEEWLGKKNLQVHGYVMPGSIHEEIQGQKTLRSFKLEWQGAAVDVEHAGPKPDTFKDQAEAVVRGTLARVDGRLVVRAVEGEGGIMAKCPSKYEGR